MLQLRLCQSSAFLGQLLAGIHKQILLKAVLFVVELFVAAALGDELGVRPAFEDLALLDDEDLVGTANGGQAVRDDEGGPALAKVVEALLDERLGLTVEAGGRLVEDEDARIGEQSACDRETLPLTT